VAVVTALHIDQRPCATCPYRRDTPPGIWAPEEYLKLPRYDRDEIAPVFLCHHRERKTACRGWLSVHRDSVAVRLAVLTGKIEPEAVHVYVGVDLYWSGAEACRAGLAGVEFPDPGARAAIVRLIERRARR
jgi:hypothetical protein